MDSLVWLLQGIRLAIVLVAMASIDIPKFSSSPRWSRSLCSSARGICRNALRFSCPSLPCPPVLDAIPPGLFLSRVGEWRITCPPNPVCLSIISWWFPCPSVALWSPPSFLFLCLPVVRYPCSLFVFLLDPVIWGVLYVCSCLQCIAWYIELCDCVWWGCNEVPTRLFNVSPLLFVHCHSCVSIPCAFCCEPRCPFVEFLLFRVRCWPS